jgi:hypothetical protein
MTSVYRFLPSLFLPRFSTQAYVLFVAVSFASFRTFRGSRLVPNSVALQLRVDDPHFVYLPVASYLE